MTSIIKYKCKNCDFQITDENLIFYLKKNNKNNALKIIEEPLTKEGSSAMSKSSLAGFLYVSYCNNCSSYIKTYVPEMENTNFNEEEIKEIINNSSKTKSELNKILFLDFKNTIYKERRTILENNFCPNCNNTMTLVISEKIPCPKCGSKLKESFL